MRNLTNEQDVEECMNDTLLAMWNQIPLEYPEYLGAYMCRIAKNTALKKYEYKTAEKRKSHC